MQSQVRRIIHVTSNPLNLPVNDDDGWQYLATDQDAEAFGRQPLLVRNQLNPVYQNDVLLMDTTSPWWQQPDTLLYLPWGQVLVDQDSVTAAQRALLPAQLNVNFCGFNRPDEVYRIIRTYFFMEPVVRWLHLSDWNIGINVDAVNQLGRAAAVINFGETTEWQDLLNLRTTITQTSWSELLVRGTATVEEPTTKVKLIAECVDAQSGRITWSHEVNQNENNQFEVTIPATGYETNVQLRVQVRGSGSLRLSDWVVRRSRGTLGQAALGSRPLVSSEWNRDGVEYCFYPGNPKRALTVIFADRNLNENFMEPGVARSLNGPTLVLFDLRFEDGGFFLGDTGLDFAITQLISGLQRALGITPEQTVYGGMSTGTNAAIRIAQQLVPGTLVLAKPVVNVGQTALQARLARTNDYPGSLDLLLRLQRELSAERATQLDQASWADLRRGKLDRTALIIGFMSDDDYDATAAHQLLELWRTHFPAARILHKEFVGRHRDNTSDVLRWWKFQLQLNTQA